MKRMLQLQQMHNSQPVIFVYEKELTLLKSEIVTAIKKLSNRKALGPDGIPAELYKNGGTVMVEVIHQLCLEVWETGERSSDWTKSVFIPLPKKGDLLTFMIY